MDDIPSYARALKDSFEAGDTVLAQSHWEKEKQRDALRTVTFLIGAKKQSAQVMIREDRRTDFPNATIVTATEEITLTLSSGEVYTGKLRYLHHKDDKSHYYLSPTIFSSKQSYESSQSDSEFGGYTTSNAREGYMEILGMIQYISNATPESDML